MTKKEELGLGETEGGPLQARLQHARGGRRERQQPQLLRDEVSAWPSTLW